MISIRTKQGSKGVLHASPARPFLPVSLPPTPPNATGDNKPTLRLIKEAIWGSAVIPGLCRYTNWHCAHAPRLALAGKKNEKGRNRYPFRWHSLGKTARGILNNREEDRFLDAKINSEQQAK